MFRLRILILAIPLLALSALPARGWMRFPYEDAQVVERSDLIIVASIKDGSVIIVPHLRKHPDDGRSWGIPQNR